VEVKREGWDGEAEIPFFPFADSSFITLQCGDCVADFMGRWLYCNDIACNMLGGHSPRAMLEQYNCYLGLGNTFEIYDALRVMTDLLSEKMRMLVYEVTLKRINEPGKFVRVRVLTWKFLSATGYPLRRNIVELLDSDAKPEPLVLKQLGAPAFPQICGTDEKPQTANHLPHPVTIEAILNSELVKRALLAQKNDEPRIKTEPAV